MAIECPLNLDCDTQDCARLGFGVEDVSVEQLTGAGFTITSHDRGWKFLQLCSGILTDEAVAKLAFVEEVAPHLNRSKIEEDLEDSRVMQASLGYMAARDEFNKAVIEAESTDGR
ncbi:MAG TPA: hypothetical protein VG992_02310 [Candidatus Saccharimonadales bacterium]|nr:hypothetical protein [Candidatus Saccharimonadales bacterium]